MMKHILLIFIGGGVGSILRYLIDFYIQKSIKISFPLGTWLANILASFLIGFLAYRINHHSIPIHYKYLFITGLCGGLSTFSTFSYENILLMQQRQITLSAVYIIASLVFCFSGTFLGMMVSEKIR